MTHRDEPPVAVGARGTEAEAEAQAHLPGPSLWPITLAGGIALLCAGVATTWLFSAAGVVIILVALGGWIRDLRREAGRAPDPAREEASHGRS